MDQQGHQVSWGSPAPTSMPYPTTAFVTIMELHEGQYVERAVRVGDQTMTLDSPWSP
jgi:hypothetical protein